MWPIEQNDPALAGIENMADCGCNFRAYQNVVEDYTGLNMTPEEIRDSVTRLQATPSRRDPSQMAIDETFFVNDPDVIMDDAFDVLGNPSVTATAGWGSRGSEPDYFIRRGQTPNDNLHSQVLDADGQLLWDPYSPDIDLEQSRRIPVYVHD